jgi:hypothetical protein
MSVLWTLPVPSTALLDGGPIFETRPGREIALRFAYESEKDESIRRAVLVFRGVEAFKCTYYRAQDHSMLEAYDKVIDRGVSAWLQQLRTTLATNGSDGTGLVHLMVSFDDGPTYEAVCMSFAVEDE